MAAKKLTVECRCVPANPFYVRWLNRLGGLDFWMFFKNQELEKTQSNVETFEPYIEQTSSVGYTTNLVGKEIAESITFGAEMLTLNQLEALSKIAESSVVWYYVGFEQDHIWNELIIDKITVLRNTKDKLHSIEFVGRLPTVQLAI